MRLTLGITALLVVAASGSARSTPAQNPHPHPVIVYLHPAPAAIGSAGEHARAPLLSSEQAQTVLAHHLRGGQGAKSEPEYEKLAGGEAGWAHAASIGGKDGRQGDKAKVVIIQADVKHSDVLPSTLFHETPSFYLSWNHESHDLLRPYMNRAKHVVDHIVDALPASIPKFVGSAWDLGASKTAALLHKQLSALSAIADRLSWNDRSHSVSGAWESIMITAFGGPAASIKDSDAFSEEMRVEGCKGVKVALEAMTSGADQPPLAIIFLPSDLPQFHYNVPTGKRSWIPDFPSANTQIVAPASRRSIMVETAAVKDNNTTEALPAGTCYPSNRTCALDSSSCSGHGACVWSGNSTSSKTGECWSCKCSSGYLGVQCQKGDYVFQTILLIFTPLLILVVILMSVGLLSSVGGEKLPSTLNVSVGVPIKRD